MNKKLKYGVGLGGILTLSLGVGVIVSTNVQKNELVPNTGEETTIEVIEPNEDVEEIEVEYVNNENEADIVVEELIDEVVEPKAEILEPKVKSFEELFPDIDSAEVNYANLAHYIYNTENPTLKGGLSTYYASNFEHLGKIDCGDTFEECVDRIKKSEYTHTWFNMDLFMKFYGIWHNLYDYIMNNK